MEFSREGNNIIRCVISEEEIEELGYTIDDIISNGARTQQFMNQIFDLAEQEFDTKFELGIKSVRADIMPDHTISLTFSEHPGPEGVMDHIKDIVNGLLNTIPKEKWDEIEKKLTNHVNARHIERLNELRAINDIYEYPALQTELDAREIQGIRYAINEKFKGYTNEELKAAIELQTKPFVSRKQVQKEEAGPKL